MKKNAHQATQTQRTRSFTQEMHLVFAEWVNRLPFVQKNTPKAPGEEDQTSASSDKEAKGKVRKGASPR